MTKLVVLAILFYLQLNQIKAAKILAVYPTPSISHHFVFRRLTDELVNRGHQVTVITSDPKYQNGGGPQNLTEIDVHELSYQIWKESLSKESVGHKNDIFKQIVTIFGVMSNIFKRQIETQEVQEIIKEKNDSYDLLLLEEYLKPTLIFSHIFKAPVILVSSFGALNDNLRAMGVPLHPILYPVPVQRKMYNHTKLQKLEALYDSWWFESVLQELEAEDDKMLKSMFGPNTPSIKQLSNNIDMMLINMHPIWLDNQPVPPGVVFMGGIHTQTPKELPQELQTYLDSSKNGVIYFSLGTNVYPELLPSTKIQMLIKVFSQLPYDILWKWNQDTLPGKSSNIKISKWLPQSDLLRHPNIKLFITQGGLQSTDEAINAGVPLIGIPMLGDQWFNVQKYVHHGIGLHLDMGTLTEEEFRNAINKVIDDKSYRDNIIRLRDIVHDQPMSSLHRAVWWIEHVIRHGGGRHLRAAAANISWREYLELDLALIILSVVLFSIVIISFSVYWLFKIIPLILKTKIKIKSM